MILKLIINLSAMLSYFTKRQSGTFALFLIKGQKVREVKRLSFRFRDIERDKRIRNHAISLLKIKINFSNF